MNAGDARIPAGLFARLFIVFGLTAPLVTFAIAVSGLSVELKVALVVFVAAINTLLFFLTRNSFKAATSETIGARVEPALQGDKVGTDQSFASLSDAGTFFDASHDQREMFELVAARIKTIFEFEAGLLLRPSPADGTMVVAEKTVDASTSGELRFENCLSGLSYLSGEIEIDPDLKLESPVFGDSLPYKICSATAIPLVIDGRVIAVFEMFTSYPIAETSETIAKLEYIQQSITPLFLASFIADRSISNALTDSVTSIPNERAFHLVLETQIAESQRFRDERSLTVMAIDIKSFRVVNQLYGQATGDAILSISAARIRGELRKMDFLARFDDDEFLAVLPLVDEKHVDDVAGRLRTAFKESKFHVGELALAIDINIGAASFWQDGETPQELVQQARTRKQQAKSADPNNVVLFPKEYVN